MRAPWPDELDRLGDLLDTEGFRTPPHLRVLVAADPERLVGAAALEPGAGTGAAGRLQLRIRPRFLEAPAAASLIDAAATMARVHGHLPLEIQDRRERLPGRLLEQAGFVLHRTEQVWEMPTAGLHRRVKAVLPSSVRRLERLGTVWHGIPANEHVEAMARLLRDHGLAGEAGIGFEDEAASAPDGRPAGGNAIERFDRALSHVVFVNGVLAGVVLIQDIGASRCFTKYRAVAREYLAHSAAINPTLMNGPLEVFPTRGITRVLLTAQVGRQDETAQMARRSGGCLLQTTDLYRLDRAGGSR
ncbi:MAG: hypothetical protein KF833_01040 [Verrucomicrobiae bacterium]|nr:hypothetical protein [Verrucomicrobiae bacterium]